MQLLVVDAADQAAANAERAKYEDSATIESTVVVGTDVTSTVVKLMAGQTPGEGISLSYSVSPGDYLEVADGVLKVKAQKTDAGDATETVTITFTKGSKTATKDVTVTIKAKKVATPTASPAAGTYVGTQTVSLATITEGATIYYTTDGSDPTTGSTQYTGAIEVAASMTIKAIAVKADMDNSEVLTAAYVIQPVATPVITPSKTTAGNRETGVTFTVTEVAGVTYYYTTDGTTPTAATGTEYTGQVTLIAPDTDDETIVTIKVIGVKAGADDSDVAEATVTYAGIE